MNENSAGKPASTGWLRRSLQGNIFVHKNGLYRDAIGASHLRGQAKVQPVARIVLDHQQRAGLSSNRLDRSKDRVAARRSENLSRNSGAEHSRADVARVRGFMAAASSRN